MAYLVALGTVVLCLCFWSAVLTVIARLNGWSALAARYPAATPAGRTLRMQWGRFGWCDYNGVLTVRVGPAGLGIAVLFPFRPGHPPLLIPWPALRVVKVEETWWRRDVTFEVDDLPIATVRLPLKVFEAAREYLGATEAVPPATSQCSTMKS